jgi:sRNA-binding regulator protein Hfq
MRELNEIEQKEFENTLKELQKKYPHIKVSEARRIFFGSWSLAYFEERLQAIQAFDQCALQYPLELIEKAIPLRISLAEKEIQGVLKSWNPFDFTLESEGNLISIKKIDCRYLYSASDEELVKKAIRKDKRQIPFAKRGEYKWVGDDFLLKFNTKDGKEPIILKTYCGETLLGKIYWFNKYDLLLQLNTRVPLFLFRHAIFQFFKFSTFQEKTKSPHTEI